MTISVKSRERIRVTFPSNSPSLSCVQYMPSVPMISSLSLTPASEWNANARSTGMPLPSPSGSRSVPPIRAFTQCARDM